MNDGEFIPLDEESTAEKAFDALRQLGLPHMPDCGVGEYPDSLSMKIVRRSGYCSCRGASDRTVAPHVRRAHWQSFWTGKRKGRDDGKFGDELIVKWIPPISINEDAGEVIETIHR